MERESSSLPYIAGVYTAELHSDLDTVHPRRAQSMDPNETNVN